MRRRTRGMGALAIAAIGLLATSCGALERTTGVEVVVSLYSGTDNPSIIVPRSEHAGILACLQDAEAEGDAPEDYGIPAFVLEDGTTTYYVAADGLVRETSGEAVALDGCGDAFDTLAETSIGQLSDEEYGYLNGL